MVKLINTWLFWGGYATIKPSAGTSISARGIRITQRRSPLAHQPIHALRIETDDDLAEVRRMVERGDLFNFERLEDSIKGVYTSFVQYILGDQTSQLGRLDDLRTVQERIDELVSGDTLPGYMKERYLKV